MELREYQKQAVEALWGELCNSKNSAPLAVLPTGAGKSVIIAEILRRVFEFGNARALVLTHRKELLEQNRLKLAAIMRRSPFEFGLYCASLGSKTIHPITFASIQSVTNSIQKFGHINLVAVDEAHLMSRKTASSYHKVLAALRERNPKLRLIGFTATPFRLDSGHLTEGEGALFTKVAYEINIRKLIQDKYLCPLVSKRSNHNSINLEGVRVTAGDYNVSDVEDRTGSIIGQALRQCAEHKQDRKSWLLFLPSVELANQATEKLRALGVRTQCVTGNTPSQERDTYITQFKNRHIQALCSVDVLTTGFDAPNVDMLVLLRPTKSLSLYIQMVGRGTRINHGKDNCLVLDFGRNIERFGPVDNIDIPKKGDKKKNRLPPYKFCPECGQSALLNATHCEDPFCGYVWPPVERGAKELQAVASNSAILTEPELWDIEHISINQHVAKNKTIPILMISIFQTSFKQKANIPLCFDHEGWMQQRAWKWWKENVGTPPPLTVEESWHRLNQEWKTPTQAIVIKNKKYYNVERLIYADTGQASTRQDQ